MVNKKITLVVVSDFGTLGFTELYGRECEKSIGIYKNEASKDKMRFVSLSEIDVPIRMTTYSQTTCWCWNTDPKEVGKKMITSAIEGMDKQLAKLKEQQEKLRTLL